MAALQPTYDYEMSQDINSRSFIVKGTKLGVATVTASVLLAVVAFGLIALILKSALLIVVGILIATSILFFVNSKRSSKICITVYPDVLTVRRGERQQEMSRAHLNRITIENEVQKKFSRSYSLSEGRALVVGGSGIGGVAAASFRGSVAWIANGIQAGWESVS